MTAAPSTPQPSIGERRPRAPSTHQLEKAADDIRTLTGRMRRRLARESPPGLPSMAEGSVLSFLERHGSSSQSDAARSLGMQPQSLGAIVVALQSRGLIARERDPSDRRAFRVELTPAGHQTIAALRGTRNAWLASAISQHLDPDEQRCVIRATDLLQRLLDR